METRAGSSRQCQLAELGIDLDGWVLRKGYNLKLSKKQKKKKKTHAKASEVLEVDLSLRHHSWTS